MYPKKCELSQEVEKSSFLYYNEEELEKITASPDGISVAEYWKGVDREMGERIQSLAKPRVNYALFCQFFKIDSD